ncbi:MAG: CopG family transcriptional regulator [Succinivibrio sp.]|nr:CopG family transcriptional regulator [Succinivibrio sp.]
MSTPKKKQQFASPDVDAMESQFIGEAPTEAKTRKGNGGGRPKIDGRLNVSFAYTKKNLEVLDRMADKLGMTRTAFITAAIAEYMVKQKDVAELLNMPGKSSGE